MAARIQITAAELTLEAELNDSATARSVLDALPIEGVANRWGDEIYFRIPVDAEEAEDARTAMEAGELAYWPPGSAFCIFWGPTPASQSDEPRAASNVNPLGRVLGDVTVLANVVDGASIRLQAAE